MAFLSVAIKTQFNKQPFKEKMHTRLHTAVERVSFAFEGSAKKMTTKEKHVITGRYRSSINQSKGSPPSYTGLGKDGKGGVMFDHVSDGIHTWENALTLRAGTNVEYAQYLEKRYNIFARALDDIRPRINSILLNTLVGL